MLQLNTHSGVPSILVPIDRSFSKTADELIPKEIDQELTKLPFGGARFKSETIAQCSTIKQSHNPSLTLFSTFVITLHPRTFPMLDISLCILSALLASVGEWFGISCSSLAGGTAISRPLHVKRSAYCPALVGPKSASASKSAIHLFVWFLCIAWVCPSIYCGPLKSGLV